MLLGLVIRITVRGRQLCAVCHQIGVLRLGMNSLQMIYICPIYPNATLNVQQQAIVLRLLNMRIRNW